MINISGISESRTAPVIAGLAKEKNQSMIIVSTDARAKKLALNLSFFIRDKEIITLPSEDRFLLRFAAKDHELLIQRLKALKALRTGKPVVVIAPVSAAVKKIAPHSSFEETSLKIRLGDEIEISKLAKSLSLMGYERCNLVETRGQYSLRGGIADVFTPDGDYPCRVEFLGTRLIP